MGALQKKAIGAGLALVLTVSAIALVPTTASAQTRDLTGEQIGELESWCRAKGGTVTKRITGSGFQFNCFLPDGTWIACGILWGQSTWGCVRIEPSTPPTTPDDEPVTSGPAGSPTSGNVQEAPTASVKQLPTAPSVLK